MRSALKLETELCLSGRQGPQTRHLCVQPSLRPEIFDLVTGIVHERDKRIAKRAATRRWLWPCCSMIWEDRCEYGLPSEAELLASAARLEGEQPSSTGCAAVGMQDGLAEEVRCLPEGHGEDCGQSPASRLGPGIPERELLLLMAGDGGDDGWSEPSWSAPCDTVHAVECPPPFWGLGPSPTCLDEPASSERSDFRYGQPHNATQQAEPSSPWVIGFRPLPPASASSRVIGFRPSPPACTESPCPQPPPQAAEVPWPFKVLGPSPDPMPSAELIPTASQMPWPCRVLGLAVPSPSTLPPMPSLRVGGGPGLEGLLEGIVWQFMPMITEMIQKAIAEALGKGLGAEDGNQATRVDSSTAEPRLKRHKGGGRDPKRRPCSENVRMQSPLSFEGKTGMSPLFLTMPSAVSSMNSPTASLWRQ